MEDQLWYWKGGRLVAVGGKYSLDVCTAYHLIPTIPEIAEACEGVLLPYKPKRDYMRGTDNE